jgi:hypothetical protein
VIRDSQVASSFDSAVSICGKLRITCGKLRKKLWKNWGMCGGKQTFKIRIANFTNGQSRRLPFRKA